MYLGAAKQNLATKDTTKKELYMRFGNSWDSEERGQKLKGKNANNLAHVPNGATNFEH